jgi:DNA-directed RNA polymerase subunit RPC12/RpoP
MSRLVSRILLSIFMFPLAGIFYILQMVIGISLLERGMGNGRDPETIMFAACGGSTWIFVAAYWCLLWKSSVNWNGPRLARTWFAAAGALVVAGAAGLIAGSIMSGGDGAGFGTFIAGVLAIMLWLIATVFIWRETAAERAQRISASSTSAIACPTCGYNLTGLSESRCPECGSKFTLNELLAAQPNTKVEIE